MSKRSAVECPRETIVGGLAEKFVGVTLDETPELAGFVVSKSHVEVPGASAINAR